MFVIIINHTLCISFSRHINIDKILNAQGLTGSRAFYSFLNAILRKVSHFSDTEQLWNIKLNFKFFELSLSQFLSGYETVKPKKLTNAHVSYAGIKTACTKSRGCSKEPTEKKSML